MSFHKRTVFFTFPAIASALVLLTGCNPTEIPGHWADQPVTVDGDDTDWPDSTFIYNEDADTYCSIRNDSSSLYVCLRIWDAGMQHRLLQQGLQLKLMREGDKKSEYGVLFPMGAAGRTMERNKQPAGDMAGNDSHSDRLLKKLDSQKQLEIRRADGRERFRLGVGEADGVRAALGYRKGRVVYELQVPLSRSAAQVFGAGFAPGEAVTFSFAYPEMKRPAQKERKSEGMSGGGRSGGGRPGGGRPGGGMSGGGMRGGGMQGGQPDESLKLEFPVRLASTPEPAVRIE